MLCYARTSTLRVGDGVLAINGVDVDDKNSDQVARLLDDTERRPTAVLTVCRTVSAASATATTTTTTTTNSRIGQ